MTTASAGADYFGVSPRLARHLPQLFKDFTDLGANVARVVEWTRALQLPAGASVLDLGSGKGEVSLQLARELGLHCTGYELIPEFVSEANQRASELAVADRCTFRACDLTAAALPPEPVDLLLFLSVGAIFGSISDTVAQLRKQVKDQGYIILDDGYVEQGEDIPPFLPPDYGELLTLPEMESQLTCHGDRILRRYDIAPAEVEEQNRRFLGYLEQRARELGDQYPALRDELDAYLTLQRRESDWLQTRFHSGTWLLQVHH